MTDEIIRVYQKRKTRSRNSHLHPLSYRIAADRALTHLGRAIATRALVAAWHGNVRLGVDEADDARRLTTNG